MTINSIQAQLSENWELIVLSADGLPPEPKLYNSNIENGKIIQYGITEKHLTFLHGKFEWQLFCVLQSGRYL